MWFIDVINKYTDKGGGEEKDLIIGFKNSQSSDMNQVIFLFCPSPENNTAPSLWSQLLYVGKRTAGKLRSISHI